MLEKTRALLAKFKPNTFVPDGTACYDEAEIETFGQLAAGLVYAPSQIRRKLQALGVTLTRSDFYSEVPTIAELEASAARPNGLRLDHIFRDEAGLRDWLTALMPFAAEFDPPLQALDEGAFGWEGGAFSYSDAMAYYCMIRWLRPQTIVEIGCGASTQIANLACERNGNGRILAIEPAPPPFLNRLGRVEVLQARIQDIDGATLDARLQNGDILFIDTTHTVKHDSDCLHIYLRILPHLRSRIAVHAHDIYLPGPLPIEMMRDQQIFWTEQYLLYAYLIANPRAQVVYGSAYHSQANPQMLAAFMHGRYPPGGASLWFSQSGPVA